MSMHYILYVCHISEKMLHLDCIIQLAYTLIKNSIKQGLNLLSNENGILIISEVQEDKKIIHLAYRPR